MTSAFRPPLWLWAVLALSTAVCVWIAAERHRSEASAKAVHLTADLNDISLVAAASGVTLEAALLRLREAGLTAVAVTEETFEDLLESGRLAAVPGDAGRFVCSDAALADRIEETVRSRFPKSPGAPAASVSRADAEPIPLPLTAQAMLPYGVGFDRTACDLVRVSGLALIARAANPPSADLDGVRAVIAEMAAAGAEGAIFSGDQVLGWPGHLEQVADAMRDAGLWYGSIEFARQVGNSRMTAEMLDRTLRVHSMSAVEMIRTPLDDVVDRYVRAATERNIRVCYLRPHGQAVADPLDDFAQFIRGVEAGLISEGSAARTPSPVKAPEVPPWAQAVVAVSALALTVWLSGALGAALWLRVSAGVLVSLLLVAGFMTEDMRYPALVAAIAFPIWALLGAFGDEPARGRGAAWAVAAFFWITAISVAGGLHVAALLTDTAYMIALKQFMGVKVAHFLPPVAVGAYLVLRRTPWRDLLECRLRWLDVLLLAAVSFALALLIIRTGSDTPAAVSGLELQVRDLMDHWLPERPRTKEVFIGYPALVLALGFAAANRRRFLPLLVLLAAVGQASVINTLSHLHTPIAVSGVRLLVGLLAGGILGGVLWLVIRQFIRGQGPSSR